MSSKTLARVVIIALFAFTFGFIGSVVSAESTTIFAQPVAGECHSCHRMVQDAWEEGAHGHADVPCETCHSPVNEAHPQEVMPTDLSSRMCGECHVATDNEFEASVHGEEDLTCVRCHNSHSTSIRTETVQELCENCHQEINHIFSYTTHAEQGVYCLDCHLPVAEAGEERGPGDRVHTFAVDFDSCESCHSEDMHSRVEADNNCTEEMIAEAQENGEELPCSPEEALAAGILLPQDSELTATPNETNPVGFAIVGTLVGVVAGMILAPWLEKWFERLQS